MTVLELLAALVETRGITGTAQETEVAHKIFALIRNDPYFANHPAHCGMWDGGDSLGRPVIWALKKGTGSRTVIFSGHYDTVDTACYGVYEPCALQPSKLKQAFADHPPEHRELMDDLNSGQWMVGRGCADMKAGLALNLDALFRYEPGAVNVLFTAVSDEENLSAGARQAVKLYGELQKQFSLEYALAIISEPIERDVNAGEPHPFINGSAGKILPVVVARGIPAHSSAMLHGINSAHLIAQTVCQTEYDTALVSRGGALCTQPPAALLMRDLKAGYDVSMPEYCAAAFNLTFFCDTDSTVLMDRMVLNCKQAAATLLKRYKACTDAMEKTGSLPPGRHRQLDVSVMTLEELEEQAATRDGYTNFRQAARERSMQQAAMGETLVMVSIHYIRDLMAWFGGGPMMVAGIAPPYYPAVNNDYLPGAAKQILHHAMQALARKGIAAAMRDYSPAMMDLSYMSCFNPGSARRVICNMPTPPALYDMDIEAMAALGIPTLVIGPASKEIHQIGERVYIPDLVQDLPEIYQQMIVSTGHDHP